MKLIPAPLRVFKTWSMLLLSAIGVFDLGVVLSKVLLDFHIMSTEAFGTINALMVSGAIVARFIRQSIEMTTQQKVDVIRAVEAQPMKEGERDVSAELTKEPKG